MIYLYCGNEIKQNDVWLSLRQTQCFYRHFCFSPLKPTVSENCRSDLIATSFFKASIVACSCSFMILVRRILRGKEIAPSPSFEKKLSEVFFRQIQFPFTLSKASMPATGTLKTQQLNANNKMDYDCYTCTLEIPRFHISKKPLEVSSPLILVLTWYFFNS